LPFKIVYDLSCHPIDEDVKLKKKTVKEKKIKNDEGRLTHA